MTMALEDIRAGDVMLTPYDEERKIQQISCDSAYVNVGDDRWFRKSDLRNPEFRAGDKVRLRTQSGGTDYGTWNTGLTPECWALVERAPVAEKKPLIMLPWAPTASSFVWLRLAPVNGKLCTLARVEQVALKNGPCWVSHFDGAGQHYSVTLDEAKLHVDQWLAREGWVEEAAPKKPEKRAGPWKQEGLLWKRRGASAAEVCCAEAYPYMRVWEATFTTTGATGTLRKTVESEREAKRWCDARLAVDGWVLEDHPAPTNCLLCDHPGKKHYAGCRVRNDEEGEWRFTVSGKPASRIQHLGWDQPAPITVLAQNDEDVP